MATRSPTFASSTTQHAQYFLGLELCNEQLRAALVDEQLGTVGVEVVDFDSELPEYQSVLDFLLTRF
jgi:sugar (pentulose or hexulose) kinase